jgi:hypothetical protein
MEFGIQSHYEVMRAAHSGDKDIYYKRGGV